MTLIVARPILKRRIGERTKSICKVTHLIFAVTVYSHSEPQRSEGRNLLSLEFPIPKGEIPRRELGMTVRASLNDIN